LNDIHKGGLKEVLTIQDLESMQLLNHNCYLDALKNNLAQNESGFVIMDCNKNLSNDSKLDQVQNFVDEEFMTECGENYNWKDLESLVRNTSMYDGINSENIKQGDVENGYMLSSFAILAEKPDLIKRLVKSSDDLKNVKQAEVWLCDSGKFKPIMLDNKFPANDSGDAPKFATSKNDGGAWQML